MMLALLIFVLFIAIVCSYLLFAPFYVEINSIEGLYGIRFSNLAKGRLLLGEKSIFINLHFAGWKKEIDLLTKGTRKAAAKSAPGKRRSFRKIPFSLLKDLFFSFKVNKWYLTVDTGNVALNGKVYPLFYWAATYTHKPILINSLGRNEFILETENSLANILRVIIYSKIKN